MLEGTTKCMHSRLSVKHPMHAARGDDVIGRHHESTMTSDEAEPATGTDDAVDAV